MVIEHEVRIDLVVEKDRDFRDIAERKRSQDVFVGKDEGDTLVLKAEVLDELDGILGVGLLKIKLVDNK